MLKGMVAGIDVSAVKFDVAAELDGTRRVSKGFENCSSGHKKLCGWLTQGGRSARVVVESTGIYSLDLSLALHAAENIDVMVANPRALKDFARASMKRSKNDAIDAESTLEYARRMDFVPWEPPSPQILELRAISRRMAALTVERTRESNRLHATKASSQASHFVVNDIEVNIRHLDRRIEGLVKEAVRLIRKQPTLNGVFQRLTSVKGIADVSAVQILPELLILPADMTARQWVAHAGLDPREHQSGSSIDHPRRISKVGNKAIRRALYMPALVAVRFEPRVKAYYEELIGRGKKPLQAIVAVMRKLLHAIHGMIKNNEDFIGEKFRKTA